MMMVYLLIKIIFNFNKKAKYLSNEKNFHLSLKVNSNNYIES